MTVGELIKKLQTFAPELQVFCFEAVDDDPDPRIMVEECYVLKDDRGVHGLMWAGDGTKAVRIS